jgi:transposase-like protein
LLSYLTHLIPALTQRSLRSLFRARSGTTTTVTPIKVSASSINTRVLPVPVPIITTTRLFYCITALITGC